MLDASGDRAADDLGFRHAEPLRFTPDGILEVAWQVQGCLLHATYGTTGGIWQRSHLILVADDGVWWKVCPSSACRVRPRHRGGCASSPMDPTRPPTSTT